MRKGVRTLKNGYSSPYGRVHNSRITTEPKIYSGTGALMNSICAGHVISGSNKENDINQKQKVRKLVQKSNCGK